MKLKRSLFKQILTLFMGMSFATLLLTTLIFIPVGRMYIQNIKVKEMQPVLDSMEKIMQDYASGLIDDRSLERVMIAQTIANNAQLVVSDENGKLLFATRAIMDDRETMKPESVDLSTSGILEEILEVNTTYSTTTTLEGSHFESIVIGNPIELNGTVVGAIALILPVFEITRSVNTLVFSLAVSMMAVMIVMSVVLYFFSKRLTKPLHQMMKVANEMTLGDFSQKADENDQSEIGALGKSLNRMSSSLKQTLDEISMERSRLEWMLSSMKEGVVSLSNEGNIQLINPAFEQLFELNTLDEASILLTSAPLKEAFSKGLNGEFDSGQLNDKDRIIGYSVSPILGLEGNLSGCVGLFVDRSESERLEQMRRDYVANVSHELRTPLTALKAFLDPLNDDLIKDEEKKHHYYQSMLKETERLSRLINDLLELSRLQSSNESFKKQEIKMEEFMNELKEKYQTLMDAKHLNWTVDLDPNLTTLNSNEDRLEQVLSILIDNAMKFTPEHQSVSVHFTKKAKQTLITVRDTGYGIASNDLPYIFDRFYTADKARTHKSFGLGLSIAKEIIERLDGQLEVQSKLNEGTQFTLTLS